ncbi:MAG: hypothetical protein ABH872_07400 [Candidatus Omnitrophota bacterium]
MKFYKVLSISCITWFIGLCLLHYFSQRPLWLDENFVLGNIKSLNYAEIFGPLKDNQAFPRAYLLLVKLVSRPFNYNSLSLRLLPLIFMVLAFFVWKRVYGRELKNNFHKLIAVFSFASAYYITYYASELKHYSMDVLVAGLFCLYLSAQNRLLSGKPSKRFIVATAVLPFTFFLSYSSFFIFWIVIYNFLFLMRSHKNLTGIFLIFTFLSIIFSVIVYYFDLRHSLGQKALFSYWDDYFLCTKSFYCFVKSFFEGFRKLSVWWFGNSSFFRKAASFFIPFFAVSIFAGGFKSFKKDKLYIWSLEAISLIIFLELVFLGLIKKYPFTGERITLFFAPFVFSGIIKGINIFRKQRPLYLGASCLYIVFLVTCCANTFINYLKLYD